MKKIFRAIYTGYYAFRRVLEGGAVVIFMHIPTEGDTITVGNMQAEFKKLPDQETESLVIDGIKFDFILSNKEEKDIDICGGCAVRIPYSSD